MSEQYLGCLDKMSEENFSPAETQACVGFVLNKTMPVFIAVLADLLDVLLFQLSFITITHIL